MDVNFHYFAVKTVALEAGFNETEAQRIASYSQFVDDYDVWVNYIFENVPEYAKSLVDSSNVFYTVTTGFTSNPDMARLIMEKYQREIVVPFHFIPTKKLKAFPESASRSEYRTAQATIDSASLIKDLLDNAKKKYIAKEAPQGIKADEYNLMRIGLLTHIFADTYAHQNFSGFKGWENYSYLEQVTDNFDGGKDITGDYSPNVYYRVASIGHTNVSHAPDNTYITWKMKMSENEKQYYKEDYTIKYGRNNTEVFCDAAKQILWYFRLCKNLEMVDESKWQEIKSKLIKGFNTHELNETTLANHWNSITGYNYFYSKEDLWDKLLIDSQYTLTEEEIDSTIKKEYTQKDSEQIVFEYDKLRAFEKRYKTAKDDFFYYNLLAKETRDAVIE